VAEKATAMQPVASAPLRLVKPADLFKQIEELHDSIARGAFEIFENNGCICGRDLEDWFKAESELLHPVHAEVTESDHSFAVRAEVPGFKPEELEVSVDGTHVTITGKKETKEERKEWKSIYRERCSDELLRVIALPGAVDPEKVKATLKDGVLLLEMPKAAPAKKITVETKVG
jgi:HSP20 family protein